MLRQVVWLSLCLQLAWAQCNSQNCKLPNCQCLSLDPPEGLSPSNTPQLVFLTFDDAITVTNYNNYTAILKNRNNPNGCPISLTFYVNHANNDYPLAHDLYTRGNEMASKTVTYKPTTEQWETMSRDEAYAEIGGVRQLMEYYANIPASSVKGYRAPFLEAGGDPTFSALQDLGMLYDHTLSAYPTNPPIWPYTLDYGLQHGCVATNCPTGSYPKLWEVPMVMLNGLQDSLCSMADACQLPNNTAETFSYLKQNFDRSYYSNRAPVGIYLHAAWFQGWKYTLDGYIQFLDYVKQFTDVYIVSVSRGIAWMQNPVPISQAATHPAFTCPPVTPTSCQPRNCYYVNDEGQDIVMRSCKPCPPNYPWIGNLEGH